MPSYEEIQEEKRAWVRRMVETYGANPADLACFLPIEDRASTRTHASEPEIATYRSWAGAADPRILRACAPFARAAHSRGAQYRIRVNGELFTVRPEDLPSDDGRDVAKLAQYAPRVSYR